jgi:hypothetical protein
MIAQAASAQLLKLMLGDVDKTGNIGGWVGKIFGMFGSSSTAAAATGTPFSAADLAWLDTSQATDMSYMFSAVGSSGKESIAIYGARKHRRAKSR